ncbi:MAG: phosphoglucosamine mutase [Brevinema sp.]
MSLKVSVSGIRGIWGDSLNMDTIIQYSRAFAAYVLEKGGKRVLMGQDGRPTGDVLARSSASILNMMGLDVIDAGIVPTPTILYGVRECGFDAGIMLSASHNPLEWNAFKFVKKGGIFTDDDDLLIINKYIQTPSPMPSWDKVGTYYQDNSVMEKHLEAILNTIDIKLIQNSGLKVLLDPVNCSGAIITKKLFQALGIEAFYIYDKAHGHFERPAEPTPAHLKHLKAIILDKKVDIAFAQDPDADRLVIADEQGLVLSEELTPVLALKALLARGERGSIVLNMSTSKAGEKLNSQYQGRTYRSKVGEANVVKKVAQENAFYGIEGNGGVIYPAVNAGRDSLVGIALILELLAKEKKTLSQLVSELPITIMKKEKYNFNGDLDVLFKKMKIRFPSAISNTEDGLRLDLEDGSWIHLRSSNTEPIVRLIAEASTEEQVQTLLQQVNSLLLER